MKITALVKFLCCFIISFPIVLLSLACSDEDMAGLELEVILSGIEYYDSVIHAGEGDILYKRTQTAGLVDPGHNRTYNYHLTFDQGKTRMDIPESIQEQVYKIPKQTYISIHGRGEWIIQYGKFRGKPYARYSYGSRSPSGRYQDWDPRHIMTTMWPGGTFCEHLRKGGFKVKQKQDIGKTECYILENTNGERLWIAPEQGFRFLKYESKFPLQIDLPNRGIKKGALSIERRWVSYGKYGAAWFPKHSTSEWSIVGEKGQEHLLVRSQHDTKNFRLNHDIPEEKFAVEIPDGARIRVSELGRTLSKEEFLKLYGPK